MRPTLRPNLLALALALVVLVVVVIVYVVAPQQKVGLSPPPVSDWLQASVDHCHDGDTCRVSLAGGLSFNVRLAGIDAPEVGTRRGKRRPEGPGAQPLALEARDTLNGMVQRQVASLRQVDLDPYNRPVVEMVVGGRLVNALLLEAGLAELYRGRNGRLDRTPYTAAEAAARAGRRGIWGLEDFVSAKDFRRRAQSSR